MTTYDLEKGKILVKKLAIDMLGCAALVLAVSVACIIATLFAVEDGIQKRNICIFVFPVLGVIYAYFFVSFIHRYRIWFKLKRIDTAETETRTVTCAKVRCLAYTAARGDIRIYGAVLTADGHKYLYIFSDPCPKSEKGTVKSGLLGELNIEVYPRSNVIYRYKKI